jgi:hypothetical protein
VTFEAPDMPDEIHPDSIGCASKGFDDDGACLTCGCLKQCHAPPDDVLADAWKQARALTKLLAWLTAEGSREVSITAEHTDEGDGHQFRLCEEGDSWAPDYVSIAAAAEAAEAWPTEPSPTAEAADERPLEISECRGKLLEASEAAHSRAESLLIDAVDALCSAVEKLQRDGK